MNKKILLAVNGTLMRGLKLNGNMIEAGAEFVKEAKTEKHYRCWSIGDDHPAMIKTDQNGAEIELVGCSFRRTGLDFVKRTCRPLYR